MEKQRKKNEKKKRRGQIYEEVITTHINADFDALASMIAAGKLYPGAALVFPGSQEKNLRNFFLYSTSYLFNFIKIKQIDLDSVKKLIIVDTRQKNRIGGFSELIDREDIEIHIYDHHPDSGDDIHGDKELIRNSGAATSLLAGLLRDKGIAISPDEATIMCLGIHEDTGSFTFSSTTAEDYQAAAWLTELGANHNTISDMLTRELTTEQVWLLNDITHSATTQVINDTKIVLTKVIRDEYIGDFAVLVQKFMEMENLDVAFALAQMENRIYLVARSRIKNVNVAEIAEALGGGGHPYAASATIKNKTLIQVERSLQALLRNRISPTRKARDVMTSSVISVTPNETLKKATSLMTRYDINALLVITKQGTLKGYISRQIVEKAVFFELGDLKIKEYMNIEFSTISPDTPLKDAQELVIRDKIRILPVVDKDKVIGVITRTDLLNILLGDPLIPELLYDSKASSHFMRKKNIATLLRNRLPEKIIQRLKDFGQVADMLGKNVYLVGGLVRDILLNHDNLDVDIVIEGDGINFARKFAEHYKARVRTHEKFGTAVVIFEDGFKVDVATARMEYYEFPGAPPVVETSSLKLDLYRRDFTINTLAIKLNNKDYGTLIDHFGAMKDLKGKVLRVLHNLSFVEDPTRMFRAIRFEQRFDFKIGKLTLALIKNAEKINLLKEFSHQRFFMELQLILKNPNPVRAIKRMNQFNLLQFISTEIRLTKRVELLLEEIKEVIAWYNHLYLEDEFKPWKVYWYGITTSLSISALKALAEKNGMVSPDSKRMISQRESMIKVLKEFYKFSKNNYQTYTLLSSYDTESLLYMMALTKNEKAKRMISSYFTKLKGTKIQMTGKDLSQMSFQPGPIYKKIFDHILEARLNNRIKTKDDEIKFVEKNFKP